MVLGEVVDCLLRIILSENRQPLFGIMRLYSMPRARTAPRERDFICRPDGRLRHQQLCRVGN